MDSHSPSWTELLGRMTAVSFSSATGEIRWRYTDHVDEVSDGQTTFWFRRSGDMRIDDSKGIVMLQTSDSTLTRDDSGKMQIHEGETVVWSGPGSPHRMLGGRDVAEDLSNPNDFSTPRGSGSPVEIDGRHGWEFVLESPPHKPYPLSVVIDDATAAILEMRSVGNDSYYTTLTKFETDTDIDDSVFVYDGPIATDEQERRQHRHQVARMGRELSWPTPRYWPTGMEMHLNDADTDTGAFGGVLENRSGAVFARWPSGETEPTDLVRQRPGFHVHRWTANGYDWALAIETPFSEEELKRIIASIPADA